jgi:ADP-heptose:LPS heptosyltransferase
VKKQNLVVSVQGGVGKNIAFTSLLPFLAKKYDRIFLHASYPDIFTKNPYVFSLNKLNNLNYQKEIVEENAHLCLLDPYDHPDYLKKKIHLLEAWADFLNIERPPLSQCLPQLYYSEQEKYNADALMHNLKESFQDRLYILFQFNGGQSPISFDESGGKEAFNFQGEEQKRALPFDLYVELIQKIHEKYPNLVLLRYGLPNETIPSPLLSIVTSLQATYYKLYKSVAEKAAAILTIDSSLQHIAAAARKEAIVIWGETKPQQLGYSCHIHLSKPLKIDTQPLCRGFIGQRNEQVEFPSTSEILDTLDEFLKRPA